MKAIILAAGRGSRLTKERKIPHKSLLKINNLSLIERQIKILKKNNISEIWVVTGHNSDHIKQEIAKYGVNFLYNKNYKKTDTLESFLMAKHVMNDEMITLYADVIFEEGVFLDLLNAEKFDITLSIQKIKCNEEDMKTHVKGNLVEKIDKKLQTEFSNSRYAGIAKFSRNGCKIFKNVLEKFEEQNCLDGDISKVFEEIIKNELPIHSNFTDNRIWINVNTVNSFKNAELIFGRKSSNRF
ncbi:NTP transferase domain-containing protein [Candidatus Nitrosopelagicus sp.]|nr:NTP transferase domain-containing protein [Candidatus Nitrosopelagicus sp.]